MLLFAATPKRKCAKTVRTPTAANLDDVVESRHVTFIDVEEHLGFERATIHFAECVSLLASRHVVLQNVLAFGRVGHVFCRMCGPLGKPAFEFATLGNAVFQWRQV